jgi:adenylosuccinate lyase
VELAVVRAQAARGRVPVEAAAAITSRARVDVARIAQLERTTDHDVVAFVRQLAETVGPEGRYLHLGLTSSDVLDTALALQCRAAAEQILADCDAAIAVLVRRAREHADTLMMGRTHSVHAEPITFGVKLAGWAFELDRDRSRLRAAASDLATGKLSGPVGTYGELDPALEAEVLGALGLAVDPVSTQIVQRDRHAAFLAAIAITGGSIERFANEIRNLAHTEIGELEEPFRAGQAGSSAMPHKRNPIRSERLVGLSRLLRGYAQAALEDQALWHERDISHSSVERVILPDATILLDYMLATFTDLLQGLQVDAERMRANVAADLGLHASGQVLLALVEEAGLPREAAYEIVQRNARRAAEEGQPLADLLATDAAAAGLAPEALAACFDEARFRRHVPAILERLERLTPPGAAS